MIVIIDYGLGNLGSIVNMLRVIGANSIITSDKNYCSPKLMKYIINETEFFIIEETFNFKILKYCLILNNSFFLFISFNIFVFFLIK